MLSISSGFDSGAITVINCANPSAIDLALRVDAGGKFRQWFHFKLRGARGQPCVLRIGNAGESSFPKGWENYRVCASYDGENWFRVPTAFDGKTLTFTVTPEHDSIAFAYFEPYGLQRHMALIDKAQMSPRVRVEPLTETPDGHEIELVTVGDALAGRAKVWIIARQHPGEAMAEWFMEGLLERLTDRADPLARVALERAVFFLVPNMNPDGAVRGHLRVNAAGVDLNREWFSPTREKSPEVFAVRERIAAVGVDLFLDIHGDEDLPYVFLAGCESLSSFTQEQAAWRRAFGEEFETASPDFQRKHGYAPARDGDGPVALSYAAQYISHNYGCFSAVLEMPFKDNFNLPDPMHGWDGARSKRLGRDVLYPVMRQLGRLDGVRAGKESEFATVHRCCDNDAAADEQRVG